MSLQFFDKALTLATNCANGHQQARTLNGLALTKRAIGDYSEAQRHACEAQERSQICGNVYQEALALHHHAVCCLYGGNNKVEIALCQEARQLLQLCGMHGGQLDIQIMITLAGAHEAKSEYAEARNIDASIIENTSSHKAPWNYGVTLVNIADIDLVIGKPEAEVYFKIEEAKEIFTAICVPSGLDYCRVVLASLKLRESNIPEAKMLFLECLNSQWGKDADAVTYVLRRVADVSCWSSHGTQWSLRWAVVYLAYAKKLQRKFDDVPSVPHLSKPRVWLCANFMYYLFPGTMICFVDGADTLMVAETPTFRKRIGSAVAIILSGRLCQASDTGRFRRTETGQFRRGGCFGSMKPRYLRCSSTAKFLMRRPQFANIHSASLDPAFPR
ncbi:hypothetical protein FB451DRAFT_1172233 [Mycena latifolia]|nr:hypothetical protein FB451DRAFT_1172233 [Mycena latifolia]